MSFKTAFIGAGSVGFTRGLVRDLMAVPEFHGIEISFMDIGERKLDTVFQWIERDVRGNGLDNVKLGRTPEIWQLVDEMLVARRQWLPQYANAIEEAEKRLRNGTRIPTRDGYEGAARLKTGTVEEMAEDRQAADRQAAEADKAQVRPPAHA